MKATSLWQPWASLLVHGLKRVETRSYGFPVLMPCTLLIHASKTWTGVMRDVCNHPPFPEAFRQMGTTWRRPLGKRIAQPDLPFGAIVGRVQVLACYPTEKVWGDAGDAIPDDAIPDGTLIISRNEFYLGDYRLGRFAWVCGSPQRFATPIPFAGKQGVFEVPDEVLADVPELRRAG